jgi:hypothetical protein
MAEYKSKEVDISFSLLLELMDALKGYGSDVVVIGGWAPYFLLKSFSRGTDEHVGSLDVDLALDFRGIPEEAYETILETIHRLGYAQPKNAAGKPIPASFEKTVTVGSVPYVMQVDFLAGEYGGNAKSHRHQRVQDMLAHKARGADVVVDQFYPEDLKGRLLNGAELTVRVNVANEVAVFTMKGICLGQRTKAKDYYDLYMLAKHFKKGPESLAESLKPHEENGLVKEAIGNIRRQKLERDPSRPVHFRTMHGVGYKFNIARSRTPKTKAFLVKRPRMSKAEPSVNVQSPSSCLAGWNRSLITKQFGQERSPRRGLGSTEECPALWGARGPSSTDRSD